MNRKFINGLLLLAVTAAGCGTFTSCKDTDDDVTTEIVKLDQSMQAKIDALSKQIAALEQAQTLCKTECAQKLAEMKADIEKAYKLADATLKSELEAAIKAGDAALKTELETKIKGIEARLKALEDLDIETRLKALEDNQLTEKDVENIVTPLIQNFITLNDVSTYLTDNNFVNAQNFKTYLDQYLDNEENLGELVDLIKGDEQINDVITTVEDMKEIFQEIKDGKYGLTEEDVNKLINAALVTVNQNITNLETTLNNRVGGLETRIDALEGDNTTNKADIDNLKTRVATLETTVTKITELETTVAGLRTDVDKALGDAAAAQTKANEAFAQATANLAKLTTLEGLIGDCTGLEDLATEVKNLKTQYSELKSTLEAKDTELEGKLKDLGIKIDGINSVLTQDIKELTARVAANEDAIAALTEQFGLLEDRLNKLDNRINSLITGILVQGTYNPLFGTFSLPIGVQSNMLVNYYGQSLKQPFDFPSYTFAPVFDDQPTITEAEAAILAACGMTPQRIENGELLMDGSLGRVFVTINPNNVNFAGKALELVNSQDKPATVKLSNLRKSDEVLTFGYSARSANNGFYEADATLAKDINAVAGAAVHIDSNLKSAMKEILKDKRNNLRSNVIALMKAVYDQVNGMLPAYGLKAGWNVDGKDYAVYSNYNIAATTFKPLSFGFLYGQSSPRKLPIIDPISNVIFNLDPEDYKFDFSDITVDINGDDVTLDFEIAPIELSYDGKISVEVEVKGDVKGEDGTVIGSFSETVPVDITGKDLDGFLKTIEEQFNQKIGTWNESISNAFEDAMDKMLANVNNAVEKMLADMQIKINDKIAGMIEDIQNEVNGKVGGYIDRFNNVITRYNNIANRLNNVLEDPNHYLQPTMFYKGANGGDYFMSNNPAKPTEIVNDGGEGFIAYATTYTAEVAAPSYRKLVAVANVIDNATGKTAADAQAQCVTINGDAKYMAEVVPGYQKRFVIPTKNMKPGYTYEILYTAVDYQGTTSTARFYVTVK